MTNRTHKNPFNITKAVDFTDKEINEYWVEISPEENSLFSDIVKPVSPMPMLILGGKGSGKTHVMRYFSYPLQKIRHNDNLVKNLTTDGYVGVYFRCGGMNAGRFQGKGYEAEAWNSIFEYFMEIWFSKLLLEIITDYSKKSNLDPALEEKICDQIIQLLDIYEGERVQTFNDLFEYFNELQTQLDVVVNNCAINKNLTEITISITRGRLIYGIPKIITENINALKDVLFLYLIDEIENLSEEQQKYVQTLIREKESPASFKIGARLYGIKTYATLSGHEKNKEGSEFETLKLDSILRSSRSNYESFAKRLILKRLQDNNHKSLLRSSESGIESLNRLFEELPENASDTTQGIQEKYSDLERPYFKNLKKMLLKFGVENGVCGKIVPLLSCPEDPVLEKINVLVFYKFLKAKKDVIESAEIISKDCEKKIKGEKCSTVYSAALTHFKSDMIAQLRKDCDCKQVYAGLDCFIDISMGLPRHLLILLKNIFGWASFNGEDLFNKPISIKSQNQGVMEASDWFFKETKMIWGAGSDIQDGLTRLGRLLKAIRFSDKPSECSVLSFSYDPTQVSKESKKVIKFAQMWSLLIEVGHRKDRNTGANLPTIQLNSLLSPKWDLPVYRRGTISLKPDEIDAIFDDSCKELFSKVLSSRISRMTAPYFGKRNNKETLPLLKAIEKNA